MCWGARAGIRSKIFHAGENFASRRNAAPEREPWLLLFLVNMVVAGMLVGMDVDGVFMVMGMDVDEVIGL